MAEHTLAWFSVQLSARMKTNIRQPRRNSSRCSQLNGTYPILAQRKPDKMPRKSKFGPSKQMHVQYGSL